MNLELLIPLLAIFMGMLVVLVPVVGITARIAMKPIMEGWARYREMRGDDQTVALLSQRVALLEEHLHSMERSLHALQDEAEFRRQLESGRGTAPALPDRAGPAA